MLAAFMTSCQLNFGGNGTGTGGNNNEPEGFIFDADSDLTIIFADDALPDKLTQKLYNAVTAAKGTRAPAFGSVALDVSDHEIIVGKCDRPASVAAYSKLEQLDDEDGENGRYVIYSDGSSVALAYDTDENFIAAETVIDIFVGAYVQGKESLVLKAGTIEDESFSYYEYWVAYDQAKRDKEWAALEEYIGGQAGTDVVNALKALYSNYDIRMVEWLASLYAPRACVCDNYDENGDRVCLYPKDENGNYLCSGGGFYYSLSALETQGYLPDIESTAQAFSIIGSSGMTSITKSAYKSIPGWMKNEIIAFLQPMQDPDSGYFWHPQWGSDVNSSRRSRDLNNAVSMLQNLGGKIWYKTPTGVDGTLSDDELSSYGFTTGRLGDSGVSLVSKVLSTSSIVTTSPWLENRETFEAYLAERDLSTRSYPIGQEMTTQSKIIIQRDLELLAEGADYQLMDILIAWFDEHQDPSTGHWHAAGTSYEAINGVLKITGVYKAAKANINYADVLAKSCIQIINNEVEPTSIVHLFNPWGALSNVLTIIENYSPEIDENGLTREERVADILAQIHAIAPEAILKTSERVAKFRKADGGFSYGINHSSASSQGEPAAVPNSPEGDVNGTMLASTGLLNNLYGALRLSGYRVGFYGHTELLMFLDIIEEASPIIKLPMQEEPSEPLTFDDDTVGDKPADINVGIASKLGEGYVVADPRPGATGNVLYFNSVNDSTSLGGNGKPDNLTLANANKAMSNAQSFVFESDFCFIGEKCPLGAGYTTQLEIGTAYAITFRIDGEGMVHIWESSSTTDSKSRNVELAVIPLDQWFNLKVEYYKGTADTVRIKVYLDGKLIAVSNNYYDASGAKITAGTSTPSKTYSSAIIRVISTCTTGMYVDNINAYSSPVAYTKPESSEGLVVNVDAPDKDEKKYTFDEEPDDIVFTGEYDLVDGALDLFTDGAAIKADIPINLRQALGNAVEMSMDITVNSASSGKIATFVLHEGGNNGASRKSVTYNLVVAGSGSDKYMTIEVVTTTSTDKLTSIEIPIGEQVNLKMVYFREVGTTLVYIDGDMIAASILQESTAPRYTPAILALSTNASVDSSITIDNLIVQRRSIDFDMATKPSVDSIVNDFESGLGDVTSGSTIIDNSGDKVLELTPTGDMSLEVNKRSNYAPTTIFGLDAIVKNGVDANSHRILFLDADGGLVFALDIEVLGNKAVIHEHVNGRTLGTVVGEADLEKEFELTVEYYPDYKEVQIFVNGKITGVTGNLSEAGDLGSDVASVRILGLDKGSSSIYVDDVILESWNKPHTEKTVLAANPEDGASVLTFESSNSGNMPKAITSSLASLGACVRVAQVIDKNNEYTSALAYDSYGGGIDGVLVGLTDQKSGSIASVFEADMCITYGSIATMYQIFFENTTKNRAYELEITKSGSGIYMQDFSHSDGSQVPNRVKGQKFKIANIGEWFNLKVEIWNGDKNTIRFKIYINGELTYVSDNYWGRQDNVAPYTSVNTVRINSLKGAQVSMYLDNVSFAQKTADDITYTDDDAMLNTAQ